LPQRRHRPAHGERGATGSRRLGRRGLADPPATRWGDLRGPIVNRGDGKTGRAAFDTDEELAALRSSLAQSDKLLHELRVHQIELEIQNRALRDAQEELESSRERYVELFDLAPSAYLTLERDGRIVEANLAAERLLGQERTAILGRRLQTLVGLSDPIAFQALVQQSIGLHGEVRGEISFRTPAQQN